MFHIRKKITEVWNYMRVNELRHFFNFWVSYALNKNNWKIQ